MEALRIIISIAMFPVGFFIVAWFLMTRGDYESVSGEKFTATILAFMGGLLMVVGWSIIIPLVAAIYVMYKAFGVVEKMVKEREGRRNRDNEKIDQ